MVKINRKEWLLCSLETGICVLFLLVGKFNM